MPLLSIAFFAGCDGSDLPTPVNEEAVPRIAATVNGSIGCGAVVEYSNGNRLITSIPRQVLPPSAWTKVKQSRGPKPKELLAIVIADELGSSDGSRTTIVCAVPQGTSPLLLKQLSQSAQRVVAERQQTGTAIRTVPRGDRAILGDWQLDALFGTSIDRYGRPTSITLTTNKSIGTSRHPSILYGSDDGVLPTIKVFADASSIFFDWRNLQVLLATLVRNHASLEIYLGTWPNDPALCTAISASWQELDALEQEILAAISQVTSDQQSGNSFETLVTCPTEAMNPKDYCLDFYIAAPTVFGLNWGNSRESNPYATISQSKLFFIPDFVGNNHRLFLGKTPETLVSLPNPLNFNYTANFMIGGEGDSALMVTRFEVVAVNDSTRRTAGNIQITVCGNAQFLNRSGRFSGLWNGVVDMMCPGITFDVTWKLRAGEWMPTSVVRDAFPTLDVIRKNESGVLEVINASPENSKAGPMALTGLWKLKYDIEQKKEELLDDLSAAGCSLQ